MIGTTDIAEITKDQVLRLLEQPRVASEMALQTLTKCLQKIRGVGRDPSDDRHRSLLRAHSERRSGD